MVTILSHVREELAACSKRCGESLRASCMVLTEQRKSRESARADPEPDHSVHGPHARLVAIKMKKMNY